MGNMRGWKRRLFWAVVLTAAAAIPQTASAQTVVKGRVLSRAGDVVPGATVKLICITETEFVSDLKAADETGHYQFDGVPAGNYFLRVTADGFDGARADVTVAGSGEVVVNPRLGEREFFFKWGENKGIDLTLIQVGSYIFYDVGDDEDGEIDLYKDGKASISLQLAGVDFVAHRSRSTGARFGINTGMALIGTSQTVTEAAGATTQTSSDYGSVFVWSASAFVDLAKVFRLEFGHVMGISAKEGLTRGQGNDSAWFVGLSVKSSLGDFVKKIR